MGKKRKKGSTPNVVDWLKERRLRKAYEAEGKYTKEEAKTKAKEKSTAPETGKIRRGAKGVESTEGGEFAKYEKKSKAAKSFREAFKEADGKDFEWDGRKYSGKTADDVKKEKAAKASKKSSGVGRLDRNKVGGKMPKDDRPIKVTVKKDARPKKKEKKLTAQEQDIKPIMKEEKEEKVLKVEVKPDKNPFFASTSGKSKGSSGRAKRRDAEVKKGKQGRGSSGRAARRKASIKKSVEDLKTHKDKVEEGQKKTRKQRRGTFEEGGKVEGGLPNDFFVFPVKDARNR